jgi:H+/Na+-translocating ferredoxin:NAD+ oxidoreductase subunit C
MKFSGGIHPKYNKATAGLAIETLPMSERYVVPVAQHLGAPGKVLVAKGDEVGKGQPLSEAQGFVSVPVHSPTSGKVTAVKELPHPLGRLMLAVEIEPDGLDTPWDGIAPVGNWRELDPGVMKTAIQAAGVVGMGGATFPTHVKLSPPDDKPIDYLILNGAECEPYLTADHRVMLEDAAEVMEGVGLMMRILGVKKAFVGVEDNKQDARDALLAACPADLDVDFALLETKYPQGSEKHLIYAMTGRTVPAGGLPMDVGCVVQNVGTAVACLQAVRDGMPMIERVATVTGAGINKPRNVRARVGTPLTDVLAYCDGVTPDVGKVIFGGPMMGAGQFDMGVPVLKGTSGVLCLREEEVAQFEGGPCIRCGNCVDVCPMGLVPSALGLFSERFQFEEMGDLHVVDCIECGSCAYVCPSHRPLVQLFKRGKVEWREITEKRKAASAV